jgi:hypothetical protein
MESIVTKVLGSYLKRFIKNFNKEMLTLQVMKGTVQIKDFGTPLPAYNYILCSTICGDSLVSRCE